VFIKEKRDRLSFIEFILSVRNVSEDEAAVEVEKL
jgi:hypothetical protein